MSLHIFTDYSRIGTVTPIVNNGGRCLLMKIRTDAGIIFQTLDHNSHLFPVYPYANMNEADKVLMYSFPPEKYPTFHVSDADYNDFMGSHDPMACENDCWYCNQ